MLTRTKFLSSKSLECSFSKRAPKLHKYIEEIPYHSIKLHLKQVFRSAYRHELETRLSHKPWREEISKVTDWPRRRAVAEFRLCVGHDCLGAHLHCIWIHPVSYCTLCSLHEPMDRNHLGHCTALSNKTEYERYWEARTKMVENWLCYFTIISPPFLWLLFSIMTLYLLWLFFVFFPSLFYFFKV